MPIISDSSTTSETTNVNTTGGNRYHVLSRNIDVTLAEIDMETFTSQDINHIYSMLPEIDSESCSAGGTVTEDGGEEFASVTGSLLDELHSDSHYLSCKRFNSHGIDLNGSSSIFDSSLIVDESSLKTLSSNGCGIGDGVSTGDCGTLTMRSERFPGLYERSNLDVSADSLDFSSSENDTHEMILRCREQDKTKYTIAFEGSISSVTTLSDSGENTKNNSEESDSITHSNHRNHHLHHLQQQQQQQQQRRRRMNGVNFISVNNNTHDGDDDDDDDYNLDDYHRHHDDDSDLVKSEYTTWNMVKRRGPIGRRDSIKLRRYPLREISKQSQSLPNIIQVTSILTGEHGEPLFPPLGSYVPLYDLNKSNTTTNSSNSEVSPPRSLIRLFIKNRNSPTTSSSPGSSSTSFEGHLTESSELIHRHVHNHHHHHHQGQQTNLSGGSGVAKGLSRDGHGPNGSYFYGDKEGNHLRVTCNGKRSIGSQRCEGWNNFEDSLVNEGGLTGNGTDTGGHVNLLQPKSGFNRLKQASPIREEDVNSDNSRGGDEAINSGTDESYHHGKDGTRNWPIYHFDKFKGNGEGCNNGDRVNIIGARRSISVDRFMSNQCNVGSGCGAVGGGGGPSSTTNGGASNNQNNIRRSSDYGSTNINKIRFSSGREFGSVSSGYLSSRQGSSEWHRKTVFTQQQQQQQPASSQQQCKPSSSSSSLPHQYPLNPSSSSSSIPSSKRYSISVTTMRTASTQVPVHIQDKQVQTGINTQLGGGVGVGVTVDGNESSPTSGFIIREYPTHTVREKTVPLSPYYAKETFSPLSDQNRHHHHHETSPDESQRAKPLYVCFPNYSLPDLSFLRTLSCPCTPKEEGPSTVYLSPTKLKLPLGEFQSNGNGTTTTGRIRRPFGRGKGIRPKSCTDYENLIANRSFNHIKDWDSLKVLLPNEFKSLIARLEGGTSSGDTSKPEGVNTDQDQEGSRKLSNCTVKDVGQSDITNGRRLSEKSSSINNNTNPFSNNYKEPKSITSPASEVKMRPRKRSVRTLEGYQGSTEVNHGGCGCHQERKRHSLQEPPSDYNDDNHHHHHHHHNNDYHNQPHHLHHETNDPINCTYRNTISRSVTMPSCVCQSQQPICHLNCCQPYNYHHHHHQQQQQQHHFHQHDLHQYSQQQHNPHRVHHPKSLTSPGVNSCCQGAIGGAAVNGGVGGLGVGGGVGSSSGNGGGLGRQSMSTNVKSNEVNSCLVNGLFDDPSVDRLCHLLSKGISVKDFTNIIGGVGTGTTTTTATNSVVGGGVGGGGGNVMTHKNRLTSPSKPCEPIKEQVIEETDSMCISSKDDDHNQQSNINNNQLLNEQLDDNRIIKGDEDELKKNVNFTVIKKRWESLASPVSSTINSPEPNLPTKTTTTTNTGGKGKTSSPPPPPPPHSITPITPTSAYSPPPPPQSTTPSTPTSNYSSPPSSSTTTTTTTTATSSSALPVKPKVPIKPPLSSLRPTSVPIAKRPTTLGANNNNNTNNCVNVFKSMIPIAKGSKSPPNVKQLTSPISKTLPRINSKKSSSTTNT